MFSTVLPKQDTNQFIFQGNIGSAASTDVIPWAVPNGVKAIRMMVIGGGSAGNHATLGTSGTTRVGGAGGNPGSITTVTFLRIMLPDILYLKCGTGGLGATTSGGTGSVGTASSISIDPAGLYVIAYAPGGTTAGTAGAAAAGPSNHPFSFSALAVNVPTNGFIGGGGGSAAGTSVPIGSQYPLCGGAGGGGGTTANIYSAGGAITGTGWTIGVNIPGGTTLGGTGSAGAAGFISFRPFFATGGSGGGGGVIPGAGGDGAPGCGGGGTGGGNSANPTRSGNGGPGLIILTCW
ncbi:hypothetical protein UFOVP245_93 [uncultured Caudovirales phage]|uniref:Glycine-rich domain-containing protein n=1 Tax=uncultured Caudovirales phage TaxID=2100421 RepID=A0A6J7WT87_9CAUD|nr:hypothetical protein UFOVP245_93 [uncultured Caudovirales phage]